MDMLNHQITTQAPYSEDDVRAVVQTLENPLFGELRTQSDKNGQTWFCLADICTALEISNSRDVRKRLNVRGVDTIYISTSSNNRHGDFEREVEMTFINEPNLYRCIKNNKND